MNFSPVHRRPLLTVATLLLLAFGQTASPQTAKTPARRPVVAGAPAGPSRPKLVVLLVVDQMRADYIEKFLHQWTGGLRRLVQEGAWFREAAYPYAATETCVGHSTISTGALPATHGMVANSWWDRTAQKMVTCTNDPKATNSAYAGGKANGGDSARRRQATSPRPHRRPGGLDRRRNQGVAQSRRTPARRVGSAKGRTPPEVKQAEVFIPEMPRAGPARPARNGDSEQPREQQP